jgi:hypothetical protein
MATNFQPLGPNSRAKIAAQGLDPDKFVYDPSTDEAVSIDAIQPSKLGGIVASFAQPIAEAPGKLVGGFNQMVGDVANNLPGDLGARFAASQAGPAIAGSLIKKFSQPIVSQLAGVPRSGGSMEHLAGLGGGIVSAVAPLLAGPAGIPAVAEIAGLSRYGENRQAGGGIGSSALAGGLDAATMAIPPLNTAGMPIMKAAIKGGVLGAGLNAGNQVAQNVIANQSFAPDRQIFEGVGEAGMVGAGMGGLGSAVHARYGGQLLNMGGTDNPTTPQRTQYEQSRDLTRQLQQGIADLKLRQEKEAVLGFINQGHPQYTPDYIQGLTPEHLRTDPNELLSAVKEAPDTIAKIGTARQKALAKLVKQQFNITAEDVQSILAARDPNAAVEQLRAKMAPETAVETKRSNEQQALDQRTQELAAKLSAERDAQSAIAAKAQADHIAEVEAATKAQAMKLAAERDAMDSIASQYKANGISMPDGLVGPEQLQTYLNERLKLRNKESQNALKNPDSYGPTTERPGKETPYSPAAASTSAMMDAGVDLAPPERTVPEKPATVKAQLKLAKSPESSKAAALITPGEKAVVPAGLTPVETSRGTLAVNTDKVNVKQAAAATDAGKGGQVLGMSQEGKPIGGDRVVQAKVKGVPVQDEVVTQEGVPAAVEAAKAVAPEAKVTVEPIAKVIEERTGEPIKKTVTRKYLTGPDAELEQKRIFEEYLKGKPALKAEPPAILEEVGEPAKLSEKVEGEAGQPIKKSKVKRTPKLVEMTEADRRELDVLTSADDARALPDSKQPRLAELQAKSKASEKSAEVVAPAASVEVTKPVVIEAYRGVPEKGPQHVDTGRTFWSNSEAEAKGYGPNIKKEQLSFKNPLKASNWMEAKDKLGLPKSAVMDDIFLAAENKGHDGIIWEHHGKPEYVKLKTYKGSIEQPGGIGSKLKKPSSKEQGQGGFIDIPDAKEVTDKLKKVWQAVTPIVRSGVNRLNDHYGEEGKVAGNKISQLWEKKEQYNYTGQDLLAKGIKGLSRDDVKAAWEYQKDMNEFGASPMVLSDKQQKALNTLQELSAYTRSTQNAEGPYVVDKGEYRPGKYTENYTPQVFKDDVWNKIKSGDETLRGQLEKHLLSQGYSVKESDAIYKSMASEKPLIQGDKVDYGPLREPEGVDFPREWLKDPVESWVTYLNRWASDMAMSNVIEQDPMMATLRGDLNDSRGGRHIEEPSVKDNIPLSREVQRALKVYTAAMSPRQNVFDKLNSIGSGAVVQHGSAMLDVLASLPTTWAQTDTVTAAKALMKVLTPGSFDEARGKGYLPSFNRSNTELQTLQAGRDILGHANKLIDLYRDKTGLHAVQDFTRLMGSFAGEMAAKDALAKGDTKYFERLGIREAFTRPAEEVVAEAANRTQKNVTSSYDGRDIPDALVPGSDNQIVRAVGGLVRFAVGQTNRQIDFMGRALRQGDITPMVKMALGGFATKALVDEVKERLFKRKPSDLTWTEWFNLDNPETARFLANQMAAANLGGFAAQVGSTMLNAGSGVKTYAPRAQSSQLLDSIAEHGMMVMDKLNQDGEFTIKDFADLSHSFLRDVVQDYRLATDRLQKDTSNREVRIYERLNEGKGVQRDTPKVNPMLNNTRFQNAETPEEIKDAAGDIFQRALQGKSVPNLQNALKDPGFYPFVDKMQGSDEGQRIRRRDMQRQLGPNQIKGQLLEAAREIKPPKLKFSNEGELELRK